MEADRPTAADYAMHEARNARLAAEGAAQADAASREELERQTVVLRGQVAFLADFVMDLLARTDAWVVESDWKTLEQIKENNW